ncbi:HAD family hydrolase [Pelosinus baikalensis]|uniref:HAD family phosphatase n=1 Tax=Pelosinus baikalensis TaxID=2892015 RepID=A0ABS8HRJ6_9FIRM|nr:HAD family phosphatase [Pelosinus baikalensis]MCC5465793.1 HAD family phosphatase [Pelosinus baikalensis]
MSKKYSGVIFDFNGTLFWDTDKQTSAWIAMAEKLRGYPVSDHEMATFVLGRPNKVTMSYLAGKQLSDEEGEALSQEKEVIYRDLCRKDADHVKLAPGAINLLDYLIENHIACTIATGSEINNVNFYFEVFQLEKWFDFDKVVYDDGLLPGKPFPEIYLKSAQNLGLSPEQCIVFEDADAGIEAARRANIGQIIAIGPQEAHNRLRQLEGVDMVIGEFTDFAKKSFLTVG